MRVVYEISGNFREWQGCENTDGDLTTATCERRFRPSRPRQGQAMCWNRTTSQVAGCAYSTPL
jgi:hypothetical protein